MTSHLRSCLRFPDPRHAHGTLPARHAVSPKVLSARLGHSDIGITHDLYAHVLPGAQKEATRRIESALLDKA